MSDLKNCLTHNVVEDLHLLLSVDPFDPCIASKTPSPLAGEGWGGGEGAIYDPVGRMKPGIGWHLSSGVPAGVNCMSRLQQFMWLFTPVAVMLTN